MDLDSKVVGITRHNHDGSDRQDIARNCHQGEKLSLRREPDNPQDSNAVAVFRKNGDQLGYLSASLAEQLAPLLDARKRITAVVSEVTGGTEDHPSYGVNIHIQDGNGNGKATAAATSATHKEAEPATPRRTASAAGPNAALPARRGCATAVLGIVGGVVVLAALLTMAWRAIA